MSLPDYTWIKDADAVRDLAERMSAAPWIALDTESNSMFAYQERICLVQLNVGGALALIDPFALDDVAADLRPLAAPLQDPAVPVWLHGGEYDVACLKRELGIALAGVWDTQQAASLLGLHATGYQRLVGDLLDVHLAKSHQQHNWARRPIDDDAVRYALDDVVYLPALVETLQAIVAEADIAEEVALASLAVEQALPHDASFDPEKLWRIKGASKLSQPELSTLTALYRWRDDAAAAADRPPARFLANGALLQLARRQPATEADVHAIKPNRTVRRHAKAIAACVAAALADPPTPPDRPQRSFPTREVRKRTDRLKQWRKREAKRRGVNIQVILPTRVLAALAEAGPEADLSAEPLLGAKRLRLYGDTLRDLLR